MEKFTIAKFRAKYPNDNACLDEIFTLRFRNKFTVCPCCNNPFNYKRVTYKSKVNKDQKKSYQCVSCSNQIYPLVGTIYEKSRTPLTYWFYSIYLMISTRNGVAAKELERQLGVTYKTAFRMAHLIRKLMKTKRTDFLSGIVMVDEAYIGGKLQNMHKKKRNFLRQENLVDSNKLKVVGMIEKDGSIFSRVVNKVSEKEIIPLIKAYIKQKSTVVTDGEPLYGQLDEMNFKHIVIRHDRGEYVNVQGFTTNHIESFWSQLKREIKGTHIKVTRKYLQRYVDECCFRHEFRKKPNEMFNELMNRCA